MTDSITVQPNGYQHLRGYSIPNCTTCKTNWANADKRFEMIANIVRAITATYKKYCAELPMLDKMIWFITMQSTQVGVMCLYIPYDEVTMAQAVIPALRLADPESSVFDDLLNMQFDLCTRLYETFGVCATMAEHQSPTIFRLLGSYCHLQLGKKLDLNYEQLLQLNSIVPDTYKILDHLESTLLIVPLNCDMNFTRLQSLYTPEPD